MNIAKFVHTATGIFAAVAISATPLTASSQTLCLPRAALVAKLASDYQEELVGKGLVDQRTVAEVFTTRDGATFTIVFTQTAQGPDGAFLNSCLIAEGHNWFSLDLLPPGDSS